MSRALRGLVLGLALLLLGSNILVDGATTIATALGGQRTHHWPHDCCDWYKLAGIGCIGSQRLERRTGDCYWQHNWIQHVQYAGGVTATRPHLPGPDTRGCRNARWRGDAWSCGCHVADVVRVSRARPHKPDRRRVAVERILRLPVDIVSIGGVLKESNVA